MVTSYIDVAQLVLYAFWIFFFGLIYWLRLEDRREGYPLESDNPRKVASANQILLPPPKTFKLVDGGEYKAPNFERDGREIPGTRTGQSPGEPLEPTGDAMGANIGAGAWAKRHDEPEKIIDGRDQVVPMRADPEFTVLAGPDPRGWTVLGGDNQPAGTVTDVWVDRADVIVRYVEVDLGGGKGTRLVPFPMLKLNRDQKVVEVYSIFAKHFANVPTLKTADRVTVHEEEVISAYYAGGRLYAEPARLGPVL
ncbi:MAG: photosynthetic reaction center subunit H [Myxococcaceae bacterium]|jgi:photosynthetic reaction center H subunit|nr:photosynthetic reaction center subunit H [Myxococcaceae bacterium]